MESKPVEWQKLLCFEVKRAYSISNGALCVVDGCWLLLMKKIFIYHIIGMKYMVGIILIMYNQVN
jgi:hypothetical protein